MSETNKMDKLILNGQNIDLSPDYQNIRNKPTINGIPVDGNKTLDDFGVATKQEVQNVSEKVAKLPYGIYYGQYDDVESLPDTSQLTQKGYAYVASTDPNVFYIYTYDGEGDIWQDSGNKFDAGSLESNLSTKSKTKAPTTKAVQEGIEGVDITTVKEYSSEQKEIARENLGAQENIVSMVNKLPVVTALNNRTADVVPVTGQVKALGYKVLNPTLSFAEQVIDDNTVYEIRDNFDLGTEVEVELSETKSVGDKRFVSTAVSIANGKSVVAVTDDCYFLDSAKTTNLGKSYTNNSGESVTVYLSTGYRTSNSKISCKRGIIYTKESSETTVTIGDTTYYLTEAIEIGKNIGGVYYTGIQVVSDDVVLINSAKTKVVGEISTGNANTTSFYLGCTTSGVNASCFLINNAEQSLSKDGGYEYTLVNQVPGYVSSAITLLSMQSIRVLGENAKILNSDKGFLTDEKFYVNRTSSSMTVYIWSNEQTTSYVLGGNITIPSRCKLKFNGGTLTNGTLLSNYQFEIEGAGLTETLVLPNKFKYVKTSWFTINDNTPAATNRNILQNICNMKYNFGMPTLICDSFTQIHVSDSIWIVKNLCITSECLYDREGSKLPKIIFDSGSFKWGYEYGTASNITNVYIMSNEHCIDVNSYGGGECRSFYNSFFTDCGFYSENGDCIHVGCTCFSNRLRNVSVQAPNGYGIYKFDHIDNIFDNIYVTGEEQSNPFYGNRCCKAVFYNCIGLFENCNIGDRNIPCIIRLENTGKYNQVVTIRNCNFEMCTGPVINATGNGTYNYIIDDVSVYLHNIAGRGYENGVQYNIFNLGLTGSLNINKLLGTYSMASGYYTWYVKRYNSNITFVTDKQRDIRLVVNDNEVYTITIYPIQQKWDYPRSFQTTDNLKVTKFLYLADNPVLSAIKVTLSTLPTTLTSANVAYIYYLTDLKIPIWWDGEAFRTVSGEYLTKIQVSDKSVLLQAAANSSQTIKVYTSDTPTTTVDANASSWLSASLSGTTLTITAMTSNETSTTNPNNPRGGKVILTNSTDEVVINVVQNYV